jgi:thiol-disulfide isomerase/thioredoxin
MWWYDNVAYAGILEGMSRYSQFAVGIVRGSTATGDSGGRNMRGRIALALGLAALVCGTLFQPALADDPVADGIARAAQTGRNVVVDFWGGWCPWCVKMDESFADPQVQALLQDRFVYVKLDVGRFENYEQQRAFFKVQGIPFLAVLDGTGHVLGTHSGYLPADKLYGFLGQSAPAQQGVATPPVPPEPRRGGDARSPITGTYDTGKATLVFTTNSLTIVLNADATQRLTASLVSVDGATLRYDCEGAAITIVVNSVSETNLNFTLRIPSTNVDVTGDARCADGGPVPPTGPPEGPGAGGGGPGAGTSPNGQWEYLTKLYGHGNTGGWGAGGSPQFEGAPQPDSYKGARGDLSLTKVDGVWTFATFADRGRPRYIEMTLGVSDATDPGVVFRFQVRLDNAAPFEYDVRLRGSKHLVLPVAGVARMEISAKVIAGQFEPNMCALVVQPKVYF